MNLFIFPLVASCLTVLILLGLFPGGLTKVFDLLEYFTQGLVYFKMNSENAGSKVWVKYLSIVLGRV